MPVTSMPHNWERAIRAVSPDGRGYAVTFECGHTVWFSIDVGDWKTAHCSQCFDDFMTQRGKSAPSS